MSRSRILVIGGLLGISLLLSLQQSRISDLQNSNSEATATAFRQQLQPGFACGVLTSIEAANFLGQQDIVSSGTIIPADSPTAATRTNSPRLDSCSYTSLGNNLTYLDVIVKTYDSKDSAAQAFAKDTGVVMYSKNGSLASATTADVYSSGVHYLLKGNMVLEVSASKVGATSGPSLEQFADSVAAFIIKKL